MSKRAFGSIKLYNLFFKIKFKALSTEKKNKSNQINTIFYYGLFLLQKWLEAKVKLVNFFFVLMLTWFCNLYIEVRNH